MTEGVELALPRGHRSSHQSPTTTEAKKVKTLNLLGDQPSISQHTQRNQTSIQRARENRNVEKRSRREILEAIFNQVSDGRQYSVAKLARATQMSWSTCFWACDLIEYCQQKPYLSRQGGTKRKRFYRLAGPRRR